uniref:Uncharacterized protein n=1 Tax=mine drainage metagenome TaxID=410659 RepID=E6QH48_9ZZZZ
MRRVLSGVPTRIGWHAAHITLFFLYNMILSA